MDNNILKYFSQELKKEASVASGTFKFVRKHPGIILGGIGTTAGISFLANRANKLHGLYVMANEHNKRKIMNKQLNVMQDVVNQIKNTEFKQPDPRRNPIKENLY